MIGRGQMKNDSILWHVAARHRMLHDPPLPPQHWQHKSKINIQGQMQVDFPFDEQVSEGYLPHWRVNVWMKTVFPCHLLVGAVVPREMYILPLCKKKKTKRNSTCYAEWFLQLWIFSPKDLLWFKQKGSFKAKPPITTPCCQAGPPKHSVYIQAGAAVILKNNSNSLFFH